MKTVVGIFTSREDAEHAVQQLQYADIPNEHINLLVPGTSKKEVESVPTTEGEQPGMGKVLGGVVGGTIGATGGVQLGTVASLFIPGVGPVIAIGLAAAALLGAGSAVGGAAAGEALEDKLSEGLPRDELFVYEDALRQGRTVLIVLVDDEAQADVARGVLIESDAEDIDSAREKWWLGLRDAEKEAYTATGGDFKTDEPTFRRGFEAALHPEICGKSYQEALEYLQEHYPDIYHEEAFRRGYERGQSYYRGLKEKHKE